VQGEDGSESEHDSDHPIAIPLASGITTAESRDISRNASGVCREDGSAVKDIQITQLQFRFASGMPPLNETFGTLPVCAGRGRQRSEHDIRDHPIAIPLASG
jgi:hypothetical protein